VRGRGGGVKRLEDKQRARTSERTCERTIKSETRRDSESNSNSESESRRENGYKGESESESESESSRFYDDDCFYELEYLLSFRLAFCIYKS